MDDAAPASEAPAPAPETPDPAPAAAPPARKLFAPPAKADPPAQIGVVLLADHDETHLAGHVVWIAGDREEALIAAGTVRTATPDEVERAYPIRSLEL